MGLFDFFRRKETESKVPEDNGEEEVSEDPDEKKKRFAQRIVEMSENIENLSTKIYHLERRLELLEKKLKINEPESE